MRLQQHWNISETLNFCREDVSKISEFLFVFCLVLFWEVSYWIPLHDFSPIFKAVMVTNIALMYNAKSKYRNSRNLWLKNIPNFFETLF